MKKNNRITPACPTCRNWGQERNWALLNLQGFWCADSGALADERTNAWVSSKYGWTRSEGRGIVRAERVRVSLFRSRDLACRLASRKASSRIFHYGAFSPSPLLTSLDPFLAVSTPSLSFYPLAVSPAMVRRKSSSVPSVFEGFGVFTLGFCCLHDRRHALEFYYSYVNFCNSSSLVQLLARKEKLDSLFPIP